MRGSIPTCCWSHTFEEILRQSRLHRDGGERGFLLRPGGWSGSLKDENGQDSRCEDAQGKTTGREDLPLAEEDSRTTPSPDCPVFKQDVLPEDELRVLVGNGRQITGAIDGCARVFREEGEGTRKAGLLEPTTAWNAGGLRAGPLLGLR